VSDAALLARVRSGDDDAFGELYERHVGAARAAARALVPSPAEADDAVAEAFTRVLSILQRGGGPEQAFRPYVLTCVRHACFDRTKQVGRATPVAPGDLADLLNERYQDQPRDTLSDADVVAQAFASLPERWQLVLWSTEVDGRRPGELASELALAPAAVASLAYRARQGLAEAYLAAHLQRPAAPECAAIRSRLAVYVRGNLGSRDATNIARHLDQCPSCQALVGDLQDLNRPLRGLLVPAIVGVPAGAYMATGASLAGILGGVVPRLAELVDHRPFFAGAGVLSLTVAVGATLASLAPAAPAQPAGPPIPTTATAAVVHPVGSDGADALSNASSPPPPGPPDAATTTGPTAAGAPSPTAPGPLDTAGAAPTAGTVATVGPADTSVVPAPPVATPSVTLPSVPPVTAPSLPPVTLPSIPPVTVPAVVLPTVPSVALPPVTVPPITVPPITVPPITVATLPPITVPALPPITAPTLASPATTAPG
jgi:RNA polymerase sigma factor (sigma-70 family)